jgi:hypothetical protein
MPYLTEIKAKAATVRGGCQPLRYTMVSRLPSCSPGGILKIPFLFITHPLHEASHLTYLLAMTSHFLCVFSAPGVVYLRAAAPYTKAAGATYYVATNGNNANPGTHMIMLVMPYRYMLMDRLCE